MKNFFINIHKLFTYLKSMWWTHVLAWGTNIFFIPYILFTIIITVIHFINGNTENDGIILIRLISTIFIGILYTIVTPITILVFISEMFTSFNIKIKNKLLRTNPVYHIFWITGFVSFFISICITIFYLKIF